MRLKSWCELFDAFWSLHEHVSVISKYKVEFVWFELNMLWQICKISSGFSKTFFYFSLLKLLVKRRKQKLVPLTWHC